MVQDGECVSGRNNLMQATYQFILVLFYSTLYWLHDFLIYHSFFKMSFHLIFFLIKLLASLVLPFLQIELNMVKDGGSHA